MGGGLFSVWDFSETGTKCLAPKHTGTNAFGSILRSEIRPLIHWSYARQNKTSP